MRSEKLQDAIGEVKDEFILDADTVVKNHKRKWIVWTAAAACLCLLASGAVKLWGGPSVKTITQQWSPTLSAKDYFKNSGKGNGQNRTSDSASIVVPPFSIQVSLDDDRNKLEEDGVLPVMPDHQEQFFFAGYHGDGSLYKVSFSWMRRGKTNAEYSTLTLTAAPKELHEVSDVVYVRTDEKGNALPPDLTVTERDGILITAQGSEEEDKTLTWQTEQGWYQITGSWNDSYEDMVALLDWFWLHPLDLSRFASLAEKDMVVATRAEQPDAFREQVPDFASLGYETQTERINLWRRGDGSKPASVYRLHPVCFEGVYTRGDTVVRWTVSQSADADAWKNCLGRPEEITEEKVNKAVSLNGSFNLFFDVPCMATLSIESGTAADAWKIVQSLQN